MRCRSATLPFSARLPVELGRCGSRGVWGERIPHRPRLFFSGGRGIGMKRKTKSELPVAQMVGLSHKHNSTPIAMIRSGPLPLQQMNVARPSSVRAAPFHFAAPTFRRTRMTVDGRSGSRPLLDRACGSIGWNEPQGILVSHNGFYRTNRYLACLGDPSLARRPSFTRSSRYLVAVALETCRSICISSLSIICFFCANWISLSSFP